MTDLTPAERNTLAWKTLRCRYAPCVQPVGRRCVTKSGARTTPHAARIADITAWLAGAASRDAEVADLQMGLDAADATVTELNAGLRARVEELDALTIQLKTARAGAALVPGLQQQVADLLAKIAKLTEPPPVEPTPEPTPTEKVLLFDDFTSGVLDPKMWKVFNNSTMDGREDRSFSRNITFEDGLLTATNKRETTTGSGNPPARTVSGIMIQSQATFYLPNSYVMEYRFRTGWTDGFWPGFVWVTNVDAPGGGGEFDSAECFFSKKKPACNLHSLPYGTGHLQQEQLSTLGDYPTEFITVRTVKTDTSYDVWHNGKAVAHFDQKSRGWRDSHHGNPAHRWKIWINTQAGSWGGDTSKTDYSKARAQLDYIKVTAG